jgi:predicted DCC family thiol-disulfide oxidoreductase YuxK
MEYSDNIILYDGICNFCNQTVQFIIRHERKPELLFASLQSETGLKLIEKYKVDESGSGTFVYIRKGRAYTRSTAGLLITLKLKGLWPLMSVFLIVPWFIRDLVYRFISRNRLKWWGSTDSCQIPPPEIRKRFIDL